MIRKTIGWGVEKFNKHTIIRYLIGGGTSAFVNLSIFTFLYYFFQIHYIVSSIIAFAIAFFVSLTFHKFWTFRDHSTDKIHVQGFLYLLSSLFGLSINTLILYACVDYFHLVPLVGQVIAGGLTACCTFFISKFYIFTHQKDYSITQ